MDEAARNAASLWLSHSDAYYHTGREWRIKLLEHNDRPNEFLLQRRVDNEFKDIETYKDLDDAKAGMEKMETSIKNKEDTEIYPWLYSKTVKKGRKFYLADKDGNPQYRHASKSWEINQTRTIS